MTDDTHKQGADALSSLLTLGFAALGEKEYAAAAGMLTKKLMISAGQTVSDMRTLRAAVGKDIFEAQLKSLTTHQARQLARRLDKDVPDLEVSTAGAACAWIRDLMDGKSAAPAEAAPEVEAAAEPPAEETPPPTDDTPAPSAAKSYFGRRSFRT